MRWFSHRARTWKDTVLKIKIKKKEKGFTLVATALAVLCWIFIAQAFFMMSSGTLSTVKAERTAYQAEQNTALDVSRLKALDYYDLDSKGAHDRKVIEGVGDGNWESEVTIDPEQPLNGEYDDAKLRIAHVKVYRTGDTTSRYSLDVPLTSRSGYIPVGSVITWPSSNLPDRMAHGDYLECNGQAFDMSKYPRLYKALGDNHVPDYRGVFLRGYGARDGKHESGNLGSVQGDATIEYKTWATGFFDYHEGEFTMPDEGTTVSWDIFHPYSVITYQNLESDPIRSNIYKYRLVPGSENSSPQLIEESYPIHYVYGTYTSWRMSNRKVAPIADEIRPINVAVRYFIKAR